MWFPMFPIVFMVLCLIIFLFVMVPMMRGHGPWGTGVTAPIIRRGVPSISSTKDMQGAKWTRPSTKKSAE